jgi:hypothetical protein
MDPPDGQKVSEEDVDVNSKDSKTNTPSSFTEMPQQWQRTMLCNAAISFFLKGISLQA